MRPLPGMPCVAPSRPSLLAAELRPLLRAGDGTVHTLGEGCHMKNRSWRESFPAKSALVALAGVLCFSGHASESQVAFPGETAAITVDVVVLDKDGKPARGLSREDFTVLEDGKPQKVVGFEVRDVSAVAEPPEGPDVPDEEELVEAAGTNEEVRNRSGRVLALLIDDLGLSAPAAQQVKVALAAWIRDRAKPEDEITLTTTSGSQWWSDVASTGRQDLLTVLGRVQGRQLARGGGFDMSTVEAYRIAVLEQSVDIAGEGSAQSRPAEVSGTTGGGVKLIGSAAIERVTQRWLDSHACSPCVDPNQAAGDCREIRVCRQRVASMAQEIHATYLLRAGTVLNAVSRLSRSLAAASGRKSILLVSEEFLQDASLGVSLRDAIDVAQRSNTTLYFMAARGLAGTPFLTAEGSSGAPRPQDLGALSTEEALLSTAGGLELADATGGTVIRSNDLAAGLEEMAAHSSSYYLLGYQPEKAPDGRWRKLEVRVARPGVKVRARSGYRSMRPEELAGTETRLRQGEPRPKKEKGDSKRPVDPELLAGHARGALPLRLATYVKDTNDVGLARVSVALEIDNGRVQVDRNATPWTALVDLTIMAASLDRAPTLPVDERLSLSLGPREVGTGWWLVPRDIWLPAGTWQIRALARDARTGVAGLVTQRLLVPDVDQTYLSTPVLTDRLVPSGVQGEPQRLVPTARRRFSRHAPLYCQYEVFVFAGRNLPGVAQLHGGHSIERVDGLLVSAVSPTPIETDGRRAVRRIELPADTLEAGVYVLTVNVEDRLSGRNLTARVPFAIEAEPPEAAQAPEATPAP